VAGRDPINIYERTTTASAAVHTVKDGRRPIAARPLPYIPTTAFSFITLRRRWVVVMCDSGGGGERCKADRRRTCRSLSERRVAVRPLWLAHRCRRESVSRVSTICYVYQPFRLLRRNFRATSSSFSVLYTTEEANFGLLVKSFLLFETFIQN